MGNWRAVSEWLVKMVVDFWRQWGYHQKTLPAFVDGWVDQFLDVCGMCWKHILTVVLGCSWCKQPKGANFDELWWALMNVGKIGYTWDTISFNMEISISPEKYGEVWMGEFLALLMQELKKSPTRHRVGHTFGTPRHTLELGNSGDSILVAGLVVFDTERSGSSTERHGHHERAIEGAGAPPHFTSSEHWRSHWSGVVSWWYMYIYI